MHDPQQDLSVVKDAQPGFSTQSVYKMRSGHINVKKGTHHLFYMAIAHQTSVQEGPRG